jgi:Cu/Ag efflux pump CusA
VAIDGVGSVARRTGRAERDEHAEPVSSSEIEVTVKPDADATAVRSAIDRIIAQVPGITTMVGQPIAHRLSHVLSGTPAAIAVSIYGEDLDLLRTTVASVERALKEVPGTRDVAANREILTPSLPILYRHADLAWAGLSPSEAAEQVRQAISGERVATIAQGMRRYDLVVRLHADDRATPSQVAELVLRGRAGQLVRLRDVADIVEQRSSYLIAHEGGRRKAVISCNVAEGENLGHLVARVRDRVDPLVTKAGLTVHYGGQFEAQQEASGTILAIGLAVAVVVYLLIAAATGSLASAGLVMVNLPLALIGGVAAIFISASSSPWTNILALLGLGGPYVAPVVSIASLVGFITLFGIAVRNGILLVNRYQARRAAGEVAEAAVINGSLDRLVAILMTALSAALGLLPLVYTAGRPGSEILAPLAVVVLGGLITSTLLNLVIVPVAYVLVFARPGQPVPISNRTTTTSGEPS